jgi:hypothetical protein
MDAANLYGGAAVGKTPAAGDTVAAGVIRYDGIGFAVKLAGQLMAQYPGIGEIGLGPLEGV